jgi:uncharacterized membrane protein
MADAIFTETYRWTIADVIVDVLATFAFFTFFGLWLRILPITLIIAALSVMRDIFVAMKSRTILTVAPGALRLESMTAVGFARIISSKNGRTFAIDIADITSVGLAQKMINYRFGHSLKVTEKLYAFPAMNRILYLGIIVQFTDRNRRAQTRLRLPIKDVARFTDALREAGYAGTFTS